MSALTKEEVAHRLHRAIAHPHLAAQLATAVFTAASTTQLATAHVCDLAPDASTVALHGDGLRQGCMTHHVSTCDPAWGQDGEEPTGPGSDCTPCTRAKELERQEAEERAAAEAEAAAARRSPLRRLFG